jgi:CDP-diacylglycerol--serine O-phosphatidyltransferase
VLRHLLDLPNLCTLAGLVCGILGIFFAVQGTFSAAMIAMLWACAFDWFDGPIARSLPGRPDEERAFGAQLDSLADLVSSGVCPAVVLLSYGQFSAWYLPGAILLVVAGAVRLAHFNVHGMVNEATYQGLAIDNNILVLSFLFLLEGSVERDTFAMVLYGTVVALASLGVSSIRTPKFVGRWYYVFSVLVLVLTGVYTWRLLA